MTNSIDYFKGFENLDCYAFDYYPNLRNAWVDSFPYAFGRGVKPSVPFWVMEFMSGGGHRLSGTGRLQPGPGALKQAVVQAFANGADLLLHYQFRSFPAGAEQLNYAIVDLDGIPRRRYYEMKETAALLKQLEPLKETSFCSEVGILLDYDSHWALKIKPVNEPEFSYMDFAGKLYYNLERVGIHSDVISLERDFSEYKALVLPASFVLKKETAKRLQDYVKQGGVLIATFLTGVKNEDNLGYTMPLPAHLAEVFGVTVQEVEPVFDSNRTRLGISLASGEDEVETKDRAWSELLAGDATPLGCYKETYKKDAMVASRHSYGDGTAYYVGTDMEALAWRTLFKSLLGPVCRRMDEIEAPEGVQVMSRIRQGKQIYFLFNFSGQEKNVCIPAGKSDFLSKEKLPQEIILEQNGFRVIV